MVRPPRRQTPEQLDEACRAFNGRTGVGEQITVYPRHIGGEIDEVIVAEPGAYVLGGHTAVVQVAGGRRAHGCIALSHVLRTRP